jgi:hypothetical protein
MNIIETAVSQGTKSTHDIKQEFLVKFNQGKEVIVYAPTGRSTISFLSFLNDATDLLVNGDKVYGAYGSFKHLLDLINYDKSYVILVRQTSVRVLGLENSAVDSIDFVWRSIYHPIKRV